MVLIWVGVICRVSTVVVNYMKHFSHANDEHEALEQA